MSTYTAVRDRKSPSFLLFPLSPPCFLHLSPPCMDEQKLHLVTHDSEEIWRPPAGSQRTVRNSKTCLEGAPMPVVRYGLHGLQSPP